MDCASSQTFYVKPPSGYWNRKFREGVYFFEWNGYIKIGESRDVVSRRRGIEASIPEGVVRPLGWIPTKFSGQAGEFEAALHKKFHQFRVRGEWFRDNAPLRRLIERACKPWPADEFGD